MPRQTGTLTYTSKKPGASTGNRFHFDFQNPDDPSLKPYAVASMVIHSPAGSFVDTSVRPRCQASDAELIVQGPSGCPANTRVGGGFVISDTGGGGPTPRFTRSTIDDFNGDHEIIGVGVNDDIPAIKSVDHTKINGNRTSTVFPVFPGFPPPEPYTPFKTLHFEFAPFASGGHPYMRTPPTCPKRGYWTFKIDFTYHDGVTQTAVSRSPCQRPKKRATKKRRRGHSHRHVDREDRD